jgi:RNA polymerase sigma factor (TIGR02999 family)
MMLGPVASDVTGWLVRWGAGDERALGELMPQVYAELRRLAGRYLQGEREGHTLQTQDLIHEAFLRLVDQRRVDWRSRAHFFAIAARMMRRILVDHARRRRYGKRGGGVEPLHLDEVPDFAPPADPDLVALDGALLELAAIDRDLARLVELRFFGGLEIGEIADALGVSKPTVQRRLRTARAWLFHHLRPEGGDEAALGD